jgi:hypothetical protein
MIGHETISAILRTGKERELETLNLQLDEDQIVYLYGYLFFVECLDDGSMKIIEKVVPVSQDIASKIAQSLNDDGLLNPEYPEYDLVRQWLLKHGVKV